MMVMAVMKMKRELRGAVGVDINRRKKRIEYLIKWAGYDSESENTWESAENCLLLSTEFRFSIMTVNKLRQNVLSVKKEHNEILAVGRFENGHHDLMSTRMLSANVQK
uniref:Chromo domain-containing protein n=1 Tax=Wuchereria bancrofti TaxID=6293 RepID=A0A1I8EX63_WUCBA